MEVAIHEVFLFESHEHIVRIFEVEVLVEFLLLFDDLVTI
jgi:hypothetical protein